MSFNILPIFSELLFSVRESEFSCFDGGVPSTGPFATRLDPFSWFGPSKGDFSMSHASNVLLRSGNMVQ